MLLVDDGLLLGELGQELVHWIGIGGGGWLVIHLDLLSRLVGTPQRICSTKSNAWTDLWSNLVAKLVGAKSCCRLLQILHGRISN